MSSDGCDATRAVGMLLCADPHRCAKIAAQNPREGPRTMEALMMERLPAEEINLSEERRAALAPKRRALLVEFDKLASLETPDREPAMTPFAGSEDDRERG